MMTARAMHHLGHVSLSVDLHSLYLATGSESHSCLHAIVHVELEPYLMTVAIERGSQAADDIIPELRQWASSLNACLAVRHSLSILETLTASDQSSPFYPFCVFAAVLTLWAYITHLPTRDLSATQLDALDKINHLLGPAIGGTGSTGRRILRKGADLLAQVKAWRIGSAFALVLVKEAERMGR